MRRRIGRCLLPVASPALSCWLRDDLVEELPVAFADDLERSNPARRSLEPSTAVILPASVANDLPDGTVAVVVSHPTDQIENQLVWRADDQSPVVHRFIELSMRVFAQTDGGK